MKKILSIILVLMLVLVMAAGCGGGNSTKESAAPISVDVGNTNEKGNTDIYEAGSTDTADNVTISDSMLVGTWYGTEGGFHCNAEYCWSFGNDGRFAYLFSAYEPPQGGGSIDSSVRERFMQGKYRENGNTIECYDIRADDFFARGDNWRYFPDRDPDLLASILLTTPLIESENVDDFSFSFEFTSTMILHLVVDRGDFPDQYDLDFEYAGDNRNGVIPSDERESGTPLLEFNNDSEYITLVEDKLNKVDLGDMLQIIMRENRTTQYRWYYDISGDDILEVVSDDYIWDPNPRGADGVGGTRAITFHCIAPGEATVEMALMQEMQEQFEDHKDGVTSQIVKYLIVVK